MKEEVFSRNWILESGFSYILELGKNENDAPRVEPFGLFRGQNSLINLNQTKKARIGIQMAVHQRHGHVRQWTVVLSVQDTVESVRAYHW